jgi:hypothetical protein
MKHKKYHYAYRITNLLINKHYYGVRSSFIQPIDDLGIKYFSSSTNKTFITDQHNNPSSFKYKIIKIFNNRDSAMLMEVKLHKKFNVANHNNFYNLSTSTTNMFSTFNVVTVLNGDKYKQISKDVYHDGIYQTVTSNKVAVVDDGKNKLISKELFDTGVFKAINKGKMNVIVDNKIKQISTTEYNNQDTFSTDKVVIINADGVNELISKELFDNNDYKTITSKSFTTPFGIFHSLSYFLKYISKYNLVIGSSTLKCRILNINNLNIINTSNSIFRRIYGDVYFFKHIIYKHTPNSLGWKRI